MKQDKAIELVAALRSGKYEQGRSRLKTQYGKYCCLGVACLVAGENFSPAGLCNGTAGILPRVVQEYFGFADKNGGISAGRGLWKNHYALTSVNDDVDSSFELVADLIEARWADL